MIYGTAPVQITNRKARKLSEDLEDLHLIKLLKSEQQPAENFQKSIWVNCHPMSPMIC